MSRHLRRSRAGTQFKTRRETGLRVLLPAAGAVPAGAVAAAARFFEHGKAAFENPAERRREIFARERDFAPFERVAHLDDAERELVRAVDQRVARARLFRRLNELAELAVFERVFDAETGVAQRRDVVQRGRPCRFKTSRRRGFRRRARSRKNPARPRSAAAAPAVRADCAA